MKSRPILFSAPMVRALLDGRKTQTRRVVKGMALDWLENAKFTPEFVALPDNDMCPYGKIGDRLWVRETWQGFRRTSHEYDEWESMQSPKDRHNHEFSPVYRADEKSFPDRWLPAIHMPREFSRITLEITGVKVERLQDISEEGAKAEGLLWNALYREWGGVEKHPCSRPGCPQWRWYEKPETAFRYLWESINGPGSWDANPWVWAIEFRRLTQ